MARRIGFFTFFALSLLSIPATYMISGPIIIGLGLAGTSLDPIFEALAMTSIPIFLLILVAAGATLAWNGRGGAATAALGIPALIGFLTVTFVIW